MSKELQKHYTTGDADLIVLKAVESATTNNTVPVGDDTDLIVLLSLKSCDLPYSRLFSCGFNFRTAGAGRKLDFEKIFLSV